MPEDYHSHPRPEVRALVPSTARMVVDVGCGAGALGAALKDERPGVQVRGIELDPGAAARAAAVLDDVAVMAGDGPLPPGWPAPDCVIFADVLEHMVDPWSALRIWRGRLREGGHIVVSLPNIAFFSILDGLWRGRWDYADEGVLDRTHLRFFTRETAVELLEQAGFRIERMERAIALPEDFLRREVLSRVVRRAVERERQGRGVPRWLLRVLDAASRQFLFAAAVTGGRDETKAGGAAA